jgi:hypothetical protein
MAKENLFTPLALNPAQIFRIEGELPAVAAARADETLLGKVMFIGSLISMPRRSCSS